MIHPPRDKVLLGSLRLVKEDEPAIGHSVWVENLLNREGQGTHKVVARQAVVVPDSKVHALALEGEGGYEGGGRVS